MTAVSTPSRAAVSRLAIARLVSVTGNGSASVALALVLYARTGSATWVGAALLIGFGVPALVSPASGLITDRFDRRRVLIVSDLLGAACFAGMAAVSAPAALLGLAAGAAIASAPFLPASGAFLPAVAPAEDLPWANSRLAIAHTAGRLAGPLAGSGLVAATGAPAAFLVNAGSFVLSAALIAGLSGERRTPGPDLGGAGPRPSLTDGFRLVLSNPTLRALTLGFALVDIGNGLVMPAEVPLARAFGAGAVGYGALVAIWAAGGLVGAPLSPRAFDRRDEPRVILVSAVALGLTFGLVAITPWFALALVAFGAGGATMSLVGVGEDLILQRRVADEVRGRVYAAHIAAVQLSLAAPLLVAGVLVDAIGPQPVFGIAAGSVALGVVVLARLLRRAGSHAAA